MGTDERSETSDREGLVDTGSAERPVDADDGGDGALQPEQARPDEGAEVPLRLVRVTRRRGGQQVSKISGTVETWSEEQEYVPGGEGE